MSERINAGILGHLKYWAIIESLLSVQSLTSRLLLDSIDEIHSTLGWKLGKRENSVAPACQLRHPLHGKAMPILRLPLAAH